MFKSTPFLINFDNSTYATTPQQNDVKYSPAKFVVLNILKVRKFQNSSQNLIFSNIRRNNS